MSFTARPLRLATTQSDFDTKFAERLHWSAETDAGVEQAVEAILADVRARGDAAVLEYTARFDGLNAAAMGELELTQAELKAAFDTIPAGHRAFRVSGKVVLDEDCEAYSVLPHMHIQATFNSQSSCVLLSNGCVSRGDHLWSAVIILLLH